MCETPEALSADGTRDDYMNSAIAIQRRITAIAMNASAVTNSYWNLRTPKLVSERPATDRNPCAARKTR